MLKRILLGCLMILISTPCFATWYETEGTAQIKNGNVSEARASAIDEALRQAMLESGSFVSSSQTVNNGIYEDEVFNIASSNDIKQYTLLNEKRQNGFLTVKIKVFIDDLTPQECVGQNYRKTIMPVLFVYGPNQFQASVNGLNDVNKYITQNFTEELKKNPKNITQPYYNKYLNIDPVKTTIKKENLIQTIKQLAKDYDSQYIVVGVIRGLNQYKKDSSWFQQNFGSNLRNVSFDIYVFDGFTGQEVFSHNYSQEAKWDIPTGTDINSEFFRNSEYGMAIAQLLKKSATDVHATIECASPKARIIKVEKNGSFYVNMGHIHKIHPRTKFYIDHSYEFKDIYNNSRATTSRADTVLNTIKVFDDVSLLEPSSYPSNNIQINDFVVIQ